ncbi:phage tail tube protein [Sphingomonas sp. TX0522]|uniref:phage tail tube protein n=1 Tax=Sphingomonas sp. TX0522 TaxID=2479205 RepID=UPI0018DEF55D|nr:phage tail tube protein [Sphingomonas sp. TX0522]MBI0530094.1 hypothetical protein [Sphingomonas sp. TX0522]
MANKNRVAGQAKVKIDGDLLDTDGTSTLDLGGKQREAVKGDYQAGSFRETTEPSQIELTLLVKAGTSLKALQDIDNATVTLEDDVGHTYIVRNAYTMKVDSYNVSEGKAKLTMGGPPAEELR